MQDVGEEIAERRRRRAVHAHRKIEPLEPHRRRVGSRVRVSDRVVPAAPIGIDQRLVGFGDPLELRRRHAVTRIDVRMKLPRQTLVRTLDVAQRRRVLDSSTR